MPREHPDLPSTIATLARHDSAEVPHLLFKERDTDDCRVPVPIDGEDTFSELPAPMEH